MPREFATRLARPCAHSVRALHDHYLTAFAILALACLTPSASQGQVDSSKAAADSAKRMEQVLITAIRAANIAPIAQRTVPRTEIEQRQFGQDVPLLLANSSPGLTVHTETGTNWGYSYLRLRGVDQTRINITLDGVPLNDMEDQVLYFANFADFMSGMQSVQVQRGVGTSSAGTASFAGSINFESMPLAVRRSGGDLQLQVGSFGAQRVSGSYQSGLLDNRLAFYARAGVLRTNGYRDHSGVRGGSGLVGAGWFGDRDIVKLTGLFGVLADTLSYVGATLDELKTNRRFNPLQPDELDRFGQQMVALSYTRIASPSTSVSSTVYRNSAGGSYDYFALPDRYRYNLAHTWYGTTTALNYAQGRWHGAVGLNANTYQRAHRAYLESASTTLYDNTGHKNDVSGFAKVLYDSGRWRWFADLQARHAEFRYAPDANAGVAGRSVSWNFVNPKGGATVQLADGLSAFASYGMTTREPARSDLFAGDDDLNSGNVDAIGDFRRVHPESVHDVEAGLNLTRRHVELQANVYRMDFRHSIERIGAPTASGLVPRRNVGAAMRQGVEVNARWQPVTRLTLSGNAWLSQNRIRSFTDSSATPVVTRRDVPPLLTPNLVTVHRADYAVMPSLQLGVEGRYQGKSYLDNTENSARTLPSSYVFDASARFTRSRYALSIRGVNLGDSQRYGSGSVSSDGEVRYFVLAGRSVFVTAEVAW
ncbi:MAG: TonB-dependent receptor [Gemmatimonadaceae bacterium]